MDRNKIEKKTKEEGGQTGLDQRQSSARHLQGVEFESVQHLFSQQYAIKLLQFS